MTFNKEIERMLGSLEINKCVVREIERTQDEAPKLRFQFARQEFSESFSRSALLTIRILDNFSDSGRKRQKEELTFLQAKSRTLKAI